MFPFILRQKAFRFKYLPLSAFLLAAVSPARAQTIAKPKQSGVEAPQLTSGARPASAIATSLRPSLALSGSGSRALLMALPEVANVTAVPSTLESQNSSASKSSLQPKSNGAPAGNMEKASFAIPGASVVASGAFSQSSAPETEIAAARRVKVTAKTRFAASRITAQPLPVSTAKSVAATAVTNVAPEITVPSAVLPAAIAPRPRGVRLPSRGGLATGGPVDVQAPVPGSAPINDSQRRLLAQLDAELGVAQRRLNRAETRLSEGQKQLGNFNDVLRSAMLDAGDDARGLHPFVRVAQRYMGTPYVWGGESARGFDCSGFIMRVMRDLGYRALPHSAAEQFRYGLPIAKPLLKAGDVVFFANTYKPGVSHVGIYLGRGQFIHAANSKVGTIVSRLNDAKWTKHYAGARRLLPVNG